MPIIKISDESLRIIEYFTKRQGISVDAYLQQQFAMQQIALEQTNHTPPQTSAVPIQTPSPTQKNQASDDQANYYNIFKQLPDALLILDHQGRLIDANLHCCQLLGYSYAELSGKTYQDFFAPEDFARIEATLKASGTPTLSIDAVRLCHQDGTIIMVELIVCHTAPDVKLMIIHDITAHEQAEDDFRISDARYRTIVEHFPNGLVALYDHDLRYTIVGGTGLSAMGLTPADFVGKRLRDLFPPDVYERDESVLRAALKGEENESIVSFGEEFFRVVTTPVKDEAGTIIGGMVMSQNISSLKQAENQQYDLAKRLALAIDTAQLGIWELDIATNHLIWNDRLHEIYGITPEEFAGDMDIWRNLVHPDDRDYADKRVASILTEGAVFNVAYRIIRPDGEIRYIDASGTSIEDEAGNPVKLLGINRDITEQLQLRLQLDDERDMAKLKANLLSILAHEFRTPLTVIMSSAEMLLHYEDRLTDIQKAKRFHNIIEQVEHLDRLIEEVSTLSRGDMGLVDFKPVSTNIEVLCQNILSELRDTISERHQIVAMFTIDNPYVRLDSNLIHRALSNLMSNAIKYSPGGGKIEFLVQTYQDELHLIVKDGGIGIPLKDQANLFSQFHRASNVGAIRGTGLGLAITKLVVEHHGGTLSFESWVGKGSTFTIRLPLESDFNL